MGLAALLGMLAACAEEPAYFGPIGPDHATGYTDQQFDQTHFRITYTGNSATPRVTVENFLLLRSAQVTLGAGYAAFLFETRDTKTKTTYFSTFTGWPGWGGMGWYGWRGGPVDGESESRPITRYEAYAEIVLLTADQAKAEPRALNAQSVLDHLVPLAAPAH
jgi:hypothetical protein